MAARSLMPASLEIPADSRASRIAAASSDGNTPSLAPSANCASASDRASPILPSALRSLRRASDSSIILAMKMVQVTSEAKASPIMTAFTSTSADWNIDHGDISPAPRQSVSAICSRRERRWRRPPRVRMERSSTARPAPELPAVATAREAGEPQAGADTSDGSDAIARAKLTTQADRKGDIFILQPSRKQDCDRYRSI